jgi:hypothetical protein
MAKDWNRIDLERRLCHALDVAERTVERLAAKGYTIAEAPDEPIRPEKIVSETALLLLAASTVPAAEVRARVDRVARLTIPHARSERMLLALSLQPALARDYAAAHLCLERIGHRDPGFDAVVRRALESQARDGRERPPHRILEQEWLLGARGGAAARLSALNHPIDLLCGTRDDIYAFTHALMYVTDFNIAPRPLPRSRAAIAAEAEVMLARCLDDEDYDLAGEVLLTWPLTGRSWSAAAAFGFRVLARVEDRAGFLPTAITRVQRLEELAGDARTDYFLGTAYHTVYVMGLLCAAALAPGRTPPAAIRSARRVNAQHLLDRIDAGGTSPHWRAELDELRPRERDALSGFLFDVALVRAVKRRDYGAVATLLRDGHLLGLAASPAASQSAELLDRLAFFAELRRQERLKETTGLPAARML